MPDRRLIRRIDKDTGKAEYHTLHEWNVINGYIKPDEIIPFVEMIDGEVVDEPSPKPRQESEFSRGARLFRERAVARWAMHVVQINRK